MNGSWEFIIQNSAVIIRSRPSLLIIRDGSQCSIISLVFFRNTTGGSGPRRCEKRAGLLLAGLLEAEAGRRNTLGRPPETSPRMCEVRTRGRACDESRQARWRTVSVGMPARASPRCNCSRTCREGVARRPVAEGRSVRGPRPPQAGQRQNQDGTSNAAC